MLPSHRLRGDFSNIAILVIRPRLGQVLRVRINAKGLLNLFSLESGVPLNRSEAEVEVTPSCPIVSQRSGKPECLRLQLPKQITAQENGDTIRGRIDALVLKEQIWLILVESKQTKFSFSVAIPQALAYMMGNLNSEKPTFGMVTNGDGFLFIKLVRQPKPTYALSDDFSLFTQLRNELYDVLRIMKRLGEIATT